MLRTLERLRRPPDLGDADSNRVARTQHWVLLVSSLLSLSLVVTALLFRSVPPQSLFVYLGAALFACSGFALLHAKRPRAAGFVFSGGFWILGAAAVPIFGVNSGALIIHMLAIIFAGFFWSPKATSYVVLASVIWLGLVAYGESAGYLPEPAQASRFRILISTSVSYALVAAMVQLAFKGIDAALGDARRSATALERSLDEQRKSDESRIRLERELAEARRLEALGRLAGGIAHDFNNLLTVVLSNAVILRDHGGSAADDCRLAEIEDAGRRASALTRQLLAVGGRQMREARVVRLARVVEAFEPLLSRLLPANVELELDLEDDAPPILADESQLEQVLVNLVANARDSMPEGGKLTVEVSTLVVDDSTSGAPAGAPPGRYAVLAVADTGDGMDEETRRSIFEPFFTTKKDGRGTGLGLATVHGIVTQSSGHVSVESEPGRGSRFVAIFPATQEAPERDPVPRPSAPVATSGLEGFALLVEDEESVRSVLHRSLANLGFEVRSVQNAEEALEAYAQMPALDLLVTDVVMPGTPGTDLARTLRASRPELPVLLVSGYAADALPDGLSMPRAAFLHKPFCGDSLAETLHELMGREGSAGRRLR